MKLDEVTLQKLEFAFLDQFTDNFVQHATIDVGSFIGEWMATEVLARFTPWGETRREWTYPETWRDSLKDRFAPRWFLKRWPAHYKRVKFGFIYPDIKPAPVDSLVYTFCEETRLTDRGQGAYATG